MGSVHAKATAIVDAEINAAINVMQNVFTENKLVGSNINIMNLSGNCKIKVDTLNMSNYMKVDMKSVVSVMQDGTFDQSVKEAVAQAADAAAKAGLGIAAADSTAITNSITNISTVVSQNIANSLQSQVLSENLFSCTDNVDFEAKIVNMSNVTEAVMDILTKSSQVATVRQSAIVEITQEVKSKAEGLDPTMLALIALAIVLVISGVGFLGVGKVVNILLNPKFWMLMSLLMGLSGAALALIRIGGDATWPYKHEDKAHNKTVLTVAGVLSGVGFLASGLTGFFVYNIENKSKLSIKK